MLLTLVQLSLDSDEDSLVLRLLGLDVLLLLADEELDED